MVKIFAETSFLRVLLGSELTKIRATYPPLFFINRSPHALPGLSLVAITDRSTCLPFAFLSLLI